jgi:hypothetical protein
MNEQFDISTEDLRKGLAALPPLLQPPGGLKAEE